MEITKEQIEKYLQSLIDKKEVVKTSLAKTPLQGLDPTKLSRKELATIGGTRVLDMHLTSCILGVSEFLEIMSEISGNPLELNQDLTKSIDELKSKSISIVGIDKGEVKINSWAEEALNKI